MSLTDTIGVIGSVMGILAGMFAAVIMVVRWIVRDQIEPVTTGVQMLQMQVAERLTRTEALVGEHGRRLESLEIRIDVVEDRKADRTEMHKIAERRDRG